MRERLEKHQVWLYLAVVLVGLVIGRGYPGVSASLELGLWPVIGLLLYVTFVQIPLVRLLDAFKDGRFLGALLLGNFVIMPALVWFLVSVIPLSDPMMLGVLLVLLVPCTDWFIAFTHLGRGDTARAIIASPLLLLMQILALPLYLWLVMGEQLASLDIAEQLLPAFLSLIVLPLLLAWLTEWLSTKRRSAKSKRLNRLVQGLSWWPVPLLALVLFMVAASQSNLVLEAGPVLWRVLVLFVLFLAAAAFVGRWLTQAFGLEASTGRTLVFSLGTRNSFVVLPLALALPDVWAMAVVVVVFQSLVELFGMMAYLKWVPSWFERGQ
ncbi:MAG: arsenic resistance protein [Saccharospirillum sp.]|nr:arsenic resistance protein [Saccharospirillum sp.]